MENVRCMSRYNYVAIQTRDRRLKFSSLMGYWLCNWWSDYVDVALQLNRDLNSELSSSRNCDVNTRMYTGTVSLTRIRVKPCLLQRNVHKVATIKRISPEEFKLHDLRFSWRFHLFHLPASRPNTIVLPSPNAPRISSLRPSWFTSRSNKGGMKLVTWHLKHVSYLSFRFIFRTILHF